MSLTSAELEAVSRIFSNDISSAISPMKKRVVSLMLKDPTLGKVARSEIKITDRMRHLIKSRPTVSPYKLPEDSASERTRQYVVKLDEDMMIRTWCLSEENSEEVREEIEQGIDESVHHIEAASRLGMRHFANVCKLTLSLLRRVFKTTFNEHPTVTHRFVPQIVAKTMAELCDDNYESLEKISQLPRKAETERSPDVKHDLPHRSVTALRAYMSEEEEGSSQEPASE